MDLLPFGEVETEGQVLVAGKGLVSVSLDGFQEVYAQGLETVRFGEESYAICNIPSVLILKLVAFDDRPEHRIKDVRDIAGILQHYPRLEAEHIWSCYMDLYEDERSHEEVALIGLGREMHGIARANRKLVERLATILQKGMTGESRLADHMVLDSNRENVAQKQEMLRFLYQGLTGSEQVVS